MDDFQVFVAQARPTLVSFARSLGRSDDAEDIVQTALARLMRFWPRLANEPFGRQYAYAKRTVANTAHTAWRRYGSRVVPTDEVQRPPHDDFGAFSADNLDLWAAFGKLPQHQQKILFLRYCAGRADSEIAEHMGCSSATVRTASFRGLKALREALAA
jgi:RNA polymerase sigma factor (sigma-70 family)